MAFQFQCPQGHLLSGDESQAGQPCHCPVCQILFLIPAPLPPSEAPVEPASAAPVHDEPPAPMINPEGVKPDLLHIPCPKGHELEVPRDMLEQDVLCPHCNSQFKLREKNSVEFKERQEKQQEIRDRKLGTAWLHWAIIIAVLVVFGLIILIASGSG